MADRKKNKGVAVEFLVRRIKGRGIRGRGKRNRAEAACFNGTASTPEGKRKKGPPTRVAGY